MFDLFLNTFIKIFFLLTPFFVLSIFLAMTRNMGENIRQKLAMRTTAAITAVAFVLFYFGNIIFYLLGITVQSFQIGAGALLFLTAVSMVRGGSKQSPSETEDISVVPLAIPYTVGPGTTGTLVVLGTQVVTPLSKIVASAALLLAILLMGVLLFMGSRIEKLLGAKVINVLTKLTGLVLAALAAQLVFTGINNFNHA